MTSVQLKQLLSLGPGACSNTSDVLQHWDSSLGFLLLGQDAQPRWSRIYLEAYIVSTVRWQPKEIFHGALLQILLPRCLGEIIDRTNLVAPKPASGLSFGVKDCLLSFLMQALVSFVLKLDPCANRLWLDGQPTSCHWTSWWLQLRWGKKYYQGGVIFNNSFYLLDQRRLSGMWQILCRISVGLRPAGWVLFWLAKFR